MSRSRASASTNETQIYNAYSLSLLSEYTHTLDSLPLDLSRNFADLRELDAVLSSQMASITAKIRKLTLMIEEGTSSKDDRLLLLQDIANEANNLKMGGDDKIRVACQAADNLKMHTGHMRSLLRHLPSFDMSVLNRQTTYPHVASRSFQPPATAESGRRRRGVGSMLSIAPDPSPVKRKRVVREEEFEVVNGKTPRKEKATDVSAHKPRHGARKKTERAASPTESLLSVTSHQQPPANSSRLGATQSLSRAANTSGTSRRSKPRHQDSLPFEDISHDQSRNRDIYNAPAASSSAHPPSLAYGGNSNGLHGGFDMSGGMSSATGDWASGHPSAGQLEGPGMPVARGSSHPALAMTGSAAISSSKLNTGDAQVAAAAVDGGAAEGGEAEGDGDDKTYCVCDRVSYGEMIACDEVYCEKEWFHLACIGLVVPPDGTWYCDACKTKRNARRGGRGGKRRTGGRAGAKPSNGG